MGASSPAVEQWEMEKQSDPAGWCVCVLGWGSLRRSKGVSGRPDPWEEAGLALALGIPISGSASVPASGGRWGWGRSFHSLPPP